MKWIKMSGIAAVAVSLVALCAEQAAAQPPYTPTLSVAVNGSSATIQWTRVNEAEGYTIQAGYAPGTPLLTHNVPASILGGTLNGIPDGVYYLRVRAYAGALAGPWSNEVQAVVAAAAGCTQPPTLMASAEVNGPMVTIGWSGVPGAVGYQVQYSRYSGITELAQNVGPGALAHQQYVPFMGTFFARVLTQNSCGQGVSNEVAFTISDLTGNGPRTPDPPPGQMLELPGYGAAVSLQVAAAYPGDLANACGSRQYLFKLVRELRKYDTRWGLNFKRGWHELSTDIVTYNGTNEPDNGADHIYLVDVVSGICAGNGWSWNWQETTDKTWDAAGSPECGTFWCAKWTLDAYLAAGYPLYPLPDPK